MSRTKKILLLSLLMILSLSCSPKKFFDFKNPTVSSSYPSNNQEGVPNNAIITIHFSEGMKQSSVTNNLSFIDSQGTVAVDYTVQWLSSSQLVIKPNKDLITGVRYKITIGEVAKDENGNKLSIPFILIFTVNPDNIQPVANIFVQNYVDASVMGFPYIPATNLKPTIKIYFSEPMDRNKTISAVTTDSMNVSYQWLDAAGNPSLIPATDFTLAIILIDELVNRKKYSIIIGSKATDLAGNNLREEKRLEFWVGNDFQMPNILDITVKKYNVVTPVSIINSQNLQNDIEAKTEIVVVFSKNMDKTSVKNAFSITPSKEVLLTWDIDDRTLRVKLAENTSYDYKTTYTVKITTEAKDLLGNPLLEQISRSFVIGSNLIPPKLEIISTDVSSVTYNLLTYGSTLKNVIRYPEFKLKFSTQMSPEAVKNAISFEPAIDIAKITFTNVDNMNYTLQVNEKLEYGKLYKIRISKNAGDLASGGLNKLDNEYMAYFYVGDPLNGLKIGNITTSCGGTYTWPDKVCLKPQITIPFVYENGALPLPNLNIDSIINSIQISNVTLRNEDVACAGNQIIINLASLSQSPLLPITRYYLTISKKIYASDTLETPLKDDINLSFLTGNEEMFGIKRMFVIGTLAPGESYWDWDGTTATKRDFNVINYVTALGPDIGGYYNVLVNPEFLQNYNPESINSSTFTVTQLSGSSISSPYPSFTIQSGTNLININIKEIKKTPAAVNEQIYIKLTIKGRESGIKSDQGVMMDQTEDFILKVTLP